MRVNSRLLGILALILLSGCSAPNSVLFVTSTSIGINADNKPPTASIAYDRTELYIGPRYDNGAVPPVVGAIQTAGTIFNPQVSQVYATGAAAAIAVGASNAKAGPTDLQGQSNRRLVFFGTGTTLGLKVGFGADGTPDSMNFGYKRTEASFIPLGTVTKDGVATDSYPSVLASINSTTTAASLKGAGLAHQQFFATGQAADALALNPSVSAVFVTNAADALTNSLTEDQKSKALALAAQQVESQKTGITKITDYIAPGGKLDTAKLSNLVDAANAKVPGSVPPALKSTTTVDQIKAMIGNNQAAVSGLVAVIPQPAGG